MNCTVRGAIHGIVLELDNYQDVLVQLIVWVCESHGEEHNVKVKAGVIDKFSFSSWPLHKQMLQGIL